MTKMQGRFLFRPSVTSPSASLPDWARVEYRARVLREIPGLDASFLRARFEADVAAEDSVAMGLAGHVESREAAVLIPVHDGPRGVELVFVKRPDTAPTHPGDLAFPGGMRDAQDRDLAGTALREAREEIGLDPSLVEILCPFPRRATMTSRVLVTPWVGWVSSLDGLVRQEAEIAGILRVPLSDLTDPLAYHGEVWEVEGKQREMSFFSLGEHVAGDPDGDVIWGMTAAILRRFLDLVFDFST